ncbi:MAG: low molecular weight protein arginine phosphatase [Deltaproteobacteria bacterium]|nr:low molecular weight protein arginine phosphatase [Deltaproteobacteria bacterium]
MAAALLRQLVEREPALADTRIESAGIAASAGDPAAPDAIALMRRRGLDLDAHRARSIDGEAVRGAELILTMTPDHLDTLRRRFPEAANKMCTLAEYAGGTEVIADPFRRGMPVYEACVAQLEPLLAQVVERLRATSSESSCP